MNLFKKVIATIAMTTLVAATTVTGVSASSTASVDAANKLAAEGVIVSHTNDTSKYELGNLVKRDEVAAVAFSVAKLTKKTKCDNEYSDVTATTPNNWACYVVEALRDNGYLAKNAKFRPEANISKAEALGMMVSAAYGDAYKYDATKGTSWQEQLVDFAVSNGILNSAFTDYNTPATRGLVFQWTVNAMDSATSTDDLGLGDLLNLGDDTNTTTGTTTDTTSTDTTANTAATTNELQVSTSPLSLTDGSQIPNKWIVRFAKVDFTAGNEDATIRNVKISKLTLASIPTGTRIWFEKDGLRLSGKAAFSSDNTAVISFAPAFVVKAGETETLDLYVQLDTVAGNDFQLKGEVTDASVPVASSFTTPLLQTASYTVASATFKSGGTNLTYTDLSSPVELGKFTVHNAYTGSETRDLAFKSITLRQDGNADLSNLGEVYLERNGKKVSESVSTDAKNITFTVNDTIKDSATATYYVKWLVDNVDNNDGDTYQFEIRKDTDVNIDEATSGFRSTINENDAGTIKVLNNLKLALYTANGSDLTFARDTSINLSQNVAKGTDDVTLLKGTISSKVPVTLEDLNLPFTIGGVSASGANKIFNNVYIKIGSTVMNWAPQTTDTEAKFSGIATLAAGQNDVRIYADIRDTAPSVTFKFNDLKLSDFVTPEYVSNQNTVTSSVGSISAISTVIDTTNVSINKVDGLGNTTVAQGSNDVELNSIALKVTQGNNVSVSNPAYTVTYSGAAQNNVFLTLYVNGNAVQTKTLDVASGNDITFENVNGVITDQPMILTVKADLSDAFANGTLKVQFHTADLSDVLTSGTVANGWITINSPAPSAVFTVAQAQGTLSDSDQNPLSQVLLAGSTDNKILAFRVRASNDNVKLRDLVFTGSNLNDLNNFKVITDGGNVVVDQATTATSTGVTFKNINTDDVISQDSTKVYYLVADVNLNTDATNVVVNLALTGSKIMSSNGNEIAMTGSDITWNANIVSQNMAVVAQDTNTNKDLANSALRFSVTATGNNEVVLTGAYIKANISGYTGDITEVKVYKDSVADTNLAATGTLNNNGTSYSGSVIFSDYKNVTAWTTVHYIVTFPNAVVDSTSNSHDWTVNLTNATVNLGKTTTGAVNYTNMGTLPLTETK